MAQLIPPYYQGFPEKQELVLFKIFIEDADLMYSLVPGNTLQTDAKQFLKVWDDVEKVEDYWETYYVAKVYLTTHHHKCIPFKEVHILRDYL